MKNSPKAKCQFLVGAIRDRRSLDDVIEAIELGASVDGTDFKGMAPIAAAAEVGWIEVAEELLDRGARAQDGLVAAMRGGHLEMVRLLQSRGASIQDWHWSDVCEGGHVHLLDALSPPDDELDSMACYGARGGHVAVLEWAQRRGHTAFSDLVTALAIICGHVEVLEWLAARGKLALRCFVHRLDRLSAVEWALSRGITLDGWLLHNACSCACDEGALDALVRAGHRITNKSLAWCQDVATVDWYVARGGPLHGVVLEWPSPSAVRRLRAVGAEVSLPDISPGDRDKLWQVCAAMLPLPLALRSK